jgi:hypothetical protein
MSPVDAVHYELDAERAREFRMPEGLCERGRAAWRAIMDRLHEEGRLHSGGCRVFYSPAEWKERGEQYGTESLLIVVHDGGDHAGYFTLDAFAYAALDRMQEDLACVGAYAETCTSWYSAVYPC